MNKIYSSLFVMLFAVTSVAWPDTLRPMSTSLNNSLVLGRISEDGAKYHIATIDGKKYLQIAFTENLMGKIIEKFDGKLEANGETYLLTCGINHKNAAALREVFPFTAPSVLGTKPAFGMGYRWSAGGNAIQARVAKRLNATVMLAQQSQREITRTQRSFQEVMDLATFSAFEAGLDIPWGGDADHLKTEDAVKEAVDAGFTYFTYDPSDFINNEYLGIKIEDLSGKELDEAFAAVVLDNTEQARLLKQYTSSSFSEDEVKRTCIKYYKALKRVSELYNYTKELKQEKGTPLFDTELSVDETERETTPQALSFIMEELKQMNIQLQAIAPRFVGNFEKAVDYFIRIENGVKLTDTTEFTTKLEEICEIAKKHEYKISVHSGSDKFTVYPILAEKTRGLLHAKTAGIFFFFFYKNIKHFYCSAWGITAICH